MTRWFLSLFLLLSSSLSAMAQGPFSLEYCYGSGCGLQGNDPPVATVPPNLYEADLAARRYGAQAAEFAQSIRNAKREFNVLRDVVGELSETPFSFESSELNATISAFFDNPDLISSLENVYSTPLVKPVSLPPSADAQLNSLWATLEGGQARDLVEAAERVRHISRYARSLESIGAQVEAASYIQGELRRNFFDENGLINFLGNHDKFGRIIVSPSGNLQVDGRIRDGLNSIIIADYILRSFASPSQMNRAEPGLGALASAYGTASALAASDLVKATHVLSSLDFAGKLTVAFVEGFLSQGLETVEAFVAMLEDPAMTAEALYAAIVNIDETAALISVSVQAKYDDFIAGDAEARSKILGEIAFEVGGVFLGGTGTIKYGSNAIKTTQNAATVVVKREFAKVARVRNVGALGTDVTEALVFVERVNPDAALRLYEGSPGSASDIGMQLRAFMRSKSSDGILGEEFLRLNPQAVAFYTDELPPLLDSLKSGESVTVYSKLPHLRPADAPNVQVDEWINHGLKGPNQKKYWQVEGPKDPFANRFGYGRFASLDADTPFLEVPPNGDGWLLFEAKFRALPNDGNGYLFFPSTKKPGGINIYDPAFDDYGAFSEIRLISEELPTP